MIYKIVCIRDRAADVFGVPVFTSSTGGAIRSFGDEINRQDNNNNMYKHPEDFDLYYVGQYDDNTGEFDCVRPQQIAVGKDLKVS